MFLFTQDPAFDKLNEFGRGDLLSWGWVISIAFVWGALVNGFQNGLNNCAARIGMFIDELTRPKEQEVLTLAKDQDRTLGLLLLLFDRLQSMQGKEDEEIRTLVGTYRQFRAYSENVGNDVGPIYMAKNGDQRTALKDLESHGLFQRRFASSDSQFCLTPLGLKWKLQLSKNVDKDKKYS